MRFKSLLALLAIVASWSAAADKLDFYYGDDIHKNRDQLHQVDLKAQLYKVLSQYHLARKDQPDQIAASCPSQQNCIQHEAVGYDRARLILFGDLYLVQDGNRYLVPDIYCQVLLETPGPNEIPDHRIVNVEHAWPQSRFSKRFSKSMQKSDLHILFPASANANSLRGNSPFGEVIANKKQVCDASALGWTSRGEINHFEPPHPVRGDLARALFYFSTRYLLTIAPEQEETLRRWHYNDPVDTAEKQRNDEIFAAQKNRNPFVDQPEWVDIIRDF